MVPDDSPLLPPQEPPEPSGGPERTAGDLDPTELDNALLVLVIDELGNTSLWAKDHLNDRNTAEHLHAVADTIASGSYRQECAACKAGHTSHGH